MDSQREIIKTVKRFVVKVGTSLITGPEAGLDKSFIQRLAGEIALLKKSGKEVVVVTSGAIGTGMARLGLAKRPATIPEKQAVAAVGQCLLMKEYEEAFRAYGMVVGQVLLTGEDLADRRRYANARQTLISLLNQRIVPIINENDTVAVEEIKLGDNDKLSALVTNLVEADLLVILTDVDGLYAGDPRKDKKATLIHVVEKITPALLSQAGGPGSLQGTGGMLTKLSAAEVVTRAGEAMVIANGRTPEILSAVLDGRRVGTLFTPHGDKMTSRKRWIAFSKKTQGTVVVDEGAKAALLEHGKSLLPSGVIKVVGEFNFGDAVKVICATGSTFAVGMVKYSSEELEKIKGKQTREIVHLLGHKFYDEVIHRDDMVILEGK